jgi:hypothetical protein
MVSCLTTTGVLWTGNILGFDALLIGVADCRYRGILGDDDL